jgi:hypothetical protein
MNLKDIIAISGQKGLFKFIKESRNGIIVESLENNKRMNAYNTAKISTLEDINVFLEQGEIKLAEIFKKIYEKENGGPAIDHKSDDAKLKSYFAEILPDYNKEKVYVSDIKKIINWYNILQGLKLLDFTKEEEQTISDENNEATKTESEEKNV